MRFSALLRIEKRFLTDVVIGWVVPADLHSHFVAPSCKLKLARFSALLRIKDAARVWKYCLLFRFDKTNYYISSQGTLELCEHYLSPPAPTSPHPLPRVAKTR